MNRQKKIQSLYNKRRKRARAKLDARPKGDRYVSKADRAKAEADAEANIEDAAIESDVEQS
ncbi:MAG: DUF2986 domain-containing protein [Gammaproteobacteria bacterium]|nr:DUF2986 domain-containing protein [Gammaproteobacteria bacterium]